jgi:hypothetical protein
VIVICEAEWEDSPVLEESTLDIAGLHASVYSQRDHWVWAVRLDPRTGRTSRGTAVNPAEAKRAAEDAILLACNPPKGEGSTSARPLGVHAGQDAHNISVSQMRGR